MPRTPLARTKCVTNETLKVIYFNKLKKNIQIPRPGMILALGCPCFKQRTPNGEETFK